MIITKGQFRWLVTASIVVTILSIVVSFSGESALPAPLRDFLTAQCESGLTVRDIVLAAVAIPLLIVYVVSLVGLYCFWRFARPLTISALVIGLILEVFLGPTVDLGLATSLSELNAVLTGIILAVIYITPAKAWFEKTQDA